MENGRVCTKCDVFKEYTEFHKSKKGKNGYDSRCKECNAKELKVWKEKNREKVRVRDRAYYNDNKERCLSRVKKYREKNRERLLSYLKEYQAKNKERLNALCREGYYKNKEHRKMMSKKWRLNNKDRVYMGNLKRRSLKHWVAFTEIKRKEILERDNWTCRICGVEVHDKKEGNWNDEFKAHLDHIIPISKGGDSTPENIQVLCRTCNLSKGNKTDLTVKNNGQIAFEV